MAKKTIEFLLTKDGASDIIVEAPENILLNFFQTLMTLRIDWPPLNIKPKDWKGFAIDILLLASIIILGSTVTILGIIFGLMFFIAYFSINKNYYWNFIQGKIDNGYVISEEQQSFLVNAGINITDREKLGEKKGFEKILNKIPGKLRNIEQNTREIANTGCYWNRNLVFYYFFVHIQFFMFKTYYNTTSK